MKSKVSIKMSDENLDFYRRLNDNCIKKDVLTSKNIKTPSSLQQAIVKYFKLNNDRYLELIQLIGQMEDKKQWN
jgi:hypothetical protein